MIKENLKEILIQERQNGFTVTKTHCEGAFKRPETMRVYSSVSEIAKDLSLWLERPTPESK